MGVGSGSSSGVVPVEGTREGVDGNAFADQERSGVMSDVGVSCRLSLNHDGMSAVTSCCLKWSAHDVSSRCAHSHVKFTLLW